MKEICRILGVFGLLRLVGTASQATILCTVKFAAWIMAGLSLHAEIVVTVTGAGFLPWTSPEPSFLFAGT